MSSLEGLTPGGQAAPSALLDILCASELAQRVRNASCAPVSIDGRRFVAVLGIDSDERRRRDELDLGAASSSALLHALWTIPHGIPFQTEALDGRDLRTLLDEGSGWVRLDGAVIERTYRPIGSVDVVAVADRSLRQAVQRAGSHPPTTRRLAIWDHKGPIQHGRVCESIQLATELGVGVIVSDGHEMETMLSPRPAQVGRPAVFRWWLSELVYRNWLTRGRALPTQ